MTIRPELAPGVFPLSEEPPSVAMEPHADKPYNEDPPRKLFFYCDRLPSPPAGRPGWASGGSPVCDTRALYRAIRPAVREKFGRLGVEYLNYNPDRAVDSGFVPWQVRPGRSYSCITPAQSMILSIC